MHAAQHSIPSTAGLHGFKFRWEDQEVDLCCEATLIGGAGAQHDIGAPHIPMDDVPLMHVGQSGHHFLCRRDDGQHVRLS